MANTKTSSGRAAAKAAAAAKTGTTLKAQDQAEKTETQTDAMQLKGRVTAPGRAPTQSSIKAAETKRAAARMKKREADRAAAEKQAHKDALVRAPEPKLLDAKKHRKRQPSLHELNQHARVGSEERRDIANDAAKAAGRAALDVLKGKGTKETSLSKRHRNLAPLQKSLHNAVKETETPAAL